MAQNVGGVIQEEVAPGVVRIWLYVPDPGEEEAFVAQWDTYVAALLLHQRVTIPAEVLMVELPFEMVAAHGLATGLTTRHRVEELREAIIALWRRWQAIAP